MSGFRFTLCNEVLGDMPFARQCEVAAGLGYGALEIAPFTLGEAPHLISAARRAELRRAAADAGIAISGLHWLLREARRDCRSPRRIRRCGRARRR